MPLEILIPSRRMPEMRKNGADRPIPTLELTLERVAGDPWQGRAIPRYGGEPGPPFDVHEGMTAEERAEVRWYVEEFMDLPEGGNLRRAHCLEERLEEFGRSLWAGISGPLVERWLGEVIGVGAGRIELRAALRTDEIAFRTPWELMRVGMGRRGGRLLQQLGVSVVRRLDADLPRLAFPDTSRGLRILLVVCRPVGTGFLDPRYTPEAILDALEDRPEVSVDFCRPPTLLNLMDKLEAANRAGDSYHILHFDGHGTTLAGEGGIGALCFEDLDGDLDLIRAPQLGDLISRYDIPLVILEACRTATPAFAKDTVAGALLRHGVGSVLAMGYAVHVDFTRELMAGFYGAMNDGASIGEALQLARNRTYARPARRVRPVAESATVSLRDWFVPQLYQGNEDPRPLPTRPKSSKKRRQPTFVGFPPEPRAGFQGRGYELHRLEQAVRSNRCVVIHGAGGMGKTAIACESARWWVRTGLFPEGAVFVSLEGSSSPGRLIASVGDALAGTAFFRKANARDWLQKELARRRLLLVWDNYEPVPPIFGATEGSHYDFAELIREWTQEGTRILVTSRSHHAGFESRAFPLGELTRSDGVMLLIGYLDRLGVNRRERKQRNITPERLMGIVIRAGGHPLALELLAPHVAKLGPEVVINQLSSLLVNSEQHAEEAGNQSLFTSLQVSVENLPKAARLALPGISLLCGGCSTHLASDVVGLEGVAWERVLLDLERTGLVRTEGMFMYPHPVLAEVWDRVAVELSGGDSVVDLQTEGNVAEGRLFKALDAFCAVSCVLISSVFSSLIIQELKITEPVLWRAVARAIAAGDLDLAHRVALSLQQALIFSGREGESNDLLEQLVKRRASLEEPLTPMGIEIARKAALARATHDPAGAIDDLKVVLARLRSVKDQDTRLLEGFVLVTLGHVLHEMGGRSAEAVPVLKEAMDCLDSLEGEGSAGDNPEFSLFSEIGDELIPVKIGRAMVAGALSNAYQALGEFSEALSLAEDAREHDTRSNNLPGIVMDEGRIAEILARQGHHTEAEERFLRVIEGAEALGDLQTLGITWHKIGELALRRGRFEAAAQPLRKALEAFRLSENDRARMLVLNSLGNLEGECGRNQEALDWYREALSIAEALADRHTETIIRGNCANIIREIADGTEGAKERVHSLAELAREERELVRRSEEEGYPLSIAYRHSNLARTLILANLLEEAEKHALAALAIRAGLGVPETRDALRTLARIASARGDEVAAAEWRKKEESVLEQLIERAGDGILPQKVVGFLLQAGLSARSGGEPPAVPATEEITHLGGSIRAFVAQYPWLLAHLDAMSTGAARPDVQVPATYIDLVDDAWRAAE